MLSIRTQDRMALVPYKETIKVKIDPKDEHCIEAHKEIGMFNKEKKLKEISPYSLITIDITLGTYATKERALEVLDEIESHVVGKLIVPMSYFERVDHLTVGSNPYVERTYDKIETLPTVYQMPKE